MRTLTTFLKTLMPAALLFVVSCQKEVTKPNDTTADEQTIGAMLEEVGLPSDAASAEDAVNLQGKKKSTNPLDFHVCGARFSVLTCALKKTDLLKTLKNLQGSYTLFAPTDAAFAGIGIKVSNLNKIPEEELKKILLYHVLSGKVPASAVPANAAVPTLNGKKVYVRKSSKGVAVNLARVTKADVKAKNGIVHVIDKVLIPPTQSIVEVVVSNPDFSLLKAAVLRASEGKTNVAALLSGDGPFTVFAPVDTAFTSIGLTTSAIANADPNSLTPVLAYHVIANAAVFSIDLSNGITPTMFSGGTTLITLTNGPQIKGNGNTEPSNIKATDIITTNGVIHVIDKVLLP